MGDLASEGDGVAGRLIVSNTGPLLHLREADSLPMMRLLGEILIPPAVAAETAVHDNAWTLTRPDWIRVVELDDPFRPYAAALTDAEALHVGEAEAIALARQTDADWFLTDDAEARRFAESSGIEVHGSLGVVLTALGDGLCSFEDATESLRRLRRSSLHMADDVWERALTALNRLRP
ncbi:MAG: hypothetical protein O3A46_10345 [Candidatus Poribacteria bacterium]|nr:hypothetical protein [Candidatus Poribacteria bacterium]